MIRSQMASEIVQVFVPFACVILRREDHSVPCRYQFAERLGRQGCRSALFDAAWSGFPNNPGSDVRQEDSQAINTERSKASK